MIWYDMILFAQNRGPKAELQCKYETRKKEEEEEEKNTDQKESLGW